MKRKFTLLIAALALLTMIVQPGRAWGQTKDDVEVSWTASEQGYTNAQDVGDITIDDHISGTFAKNSGTNGPKYYTSGESVRMYNLNSLTITPDENSTITAIIFTLSQSGGFSVSTGEYSVTGSTGTWSGSSTGSIVFTNGSAQNRIQVISVTYTYSGTPAVTHTLTYSANPTEGGTVTVGSTTLAEGATTSISATANAGYVFGSWTVEGEGSGVNEAGDTFTMGTEDATLTANFTTVTTYTVTYHANVTGIADIEVIYNEGQDVTVAANTFSNPGYAFTEWNTQADGDGDPYVAGDVIENIQADIDLYAQWEESSDVVDVLNWAATGSLTNYDDWTYTAPSGTAYKGQSSGSATGQYIQLRSNNNNSGIVTTSSIGNASKVVVTWNSATATGRTLNIYGKNTAYTAATDLYGNNAGDLLGTIVCGTSTELNITGSYAFIGMRSASAAMYLDKIEITWSTGGTPVPSYTISDNDELAYNATYGSFNFTVNNPVTGGTTTVTEDVDWISDATVTGNSVNFTTTTNPTAGPRNGIITLTYTYTGSEPVVQPVTVTQAGNPSIINDISSIDNENVFYRVRGTVVAVSARAFVLGDNTGYIYYYNGYNAPAVAIGDLKTVEGVTTSYGHIIQFPSTATITEAETSNYNGEPLCTVITEIPSSYSTGLHLSDYLQFDGTITKNNGYYYVTVGEGQINISYPSDTQKAAMDALENKTVRVKGYFAGINSSNYFSVLMETIEEVIIITPVITVDPTTADPFSYLEGNGPSDDQMFEVTGTNLTSSDIVATITTGDNIFEITDDAVYSNTVTIASGDMISVRMKAGLTQGSYEGTLTLTNEGAEPVVITLAGTVLSNATYNVTCAVTPTEAAIMEADPVSAHEGETVTLTYAAETGYSLTSIIITKTADGSATGIVPTAGANDSYTFTMPAYNVTATATFVSDIFTGSFVQFTGDFVEGDYILVYNGGAMNNDNTTTSNKLGKTDVTPSEGIITDPSSDIVWHIAPSATDGYWTIYNAKVGKYVNGAATNNTNVTLVDNPSYSNGAQWYVTKGTGDNLNKYDFGSKSTESQSTKRFLRRNVDVFGHYAASNGGYLTLYKYTNLIEHTITFNGNGGTYMSEDTYTQKVYEGIETALDANKFEKANSAFVGWSTTIDGDVEYADQALITVTADKELYAKWSTAYTAMVDSQILGGSVLIDDGQQGTDIIEAAEGTEISLIYTAEIGYAFNAWNVYNADDPTITVPVENNKFNMPAYDVIISATFVETTDIIYSLITSIDDLEPGAHYLIASEVILDKVYIMSEQGGNNRTAEEVTVNNNIITFPTEAIYYDFVICGDGTNKWTIYDEQKPGYLYAASSSSNQLKTRDANSDGNSVWNIEFDNGNLSIVAQGGYTRNTMQFNSGSSLFACYASASQRPVYLYKKYKDNNHNFYSNTKLESVTIAATENYIVHNSATLEATQSLTNEGNATNLIIEDGGQLVFSGNNVQATVKKQTIGESKADHWYTIASPVANNKFGEVTNLTSATYDLYRYNETTSTWENYKETTPEPHAGFYNGNDNSAFEAGRGYLYYNAAGSELSFAGTLNNDGVTYDLTAGSSEFTGINLIGNPYTQDITLANIEGEISEGGYVLNNANDWSASPNLTIKPCEGFLVQVVTAQEITINKTPSSKSRANHDYIALTVTNNEYEDVAYALFSNGMGLNKINHRNADIPMVYIPQDGKNYAIATMSDNTEMFNLNFKAMTTGKYTLSYKAKGVYSYLHVIDRFTGEDIDMLVEGEYSFIGSSYDNDARFIVKLSYNANIGEFDTNSIFAYQNGDEIIVNGEGQLQVYDVMGRFVKCINVNGTESISASQFSDAVYIFRMIGETVTTQKIVVR